MFRPFTLQGLVDLLGRQPKVALRFALAIVWRAFSASVTARQEPRPTGCGCSVATLSRRWDCAFVRSFAARQLET